MELWLVITSGVLALILTIIGLVVAYHTVPKSKAGIGLIGVGLLLIGGIFGGTAITGLFIMESDNLMYQLDLGAPVRELLVSEVSGSDVCGLLENGDDRLCVSKEKILNWETKAPGFDPPGVIPLTGNFYGVSWVTGFGQEGLLFELAR